MFGKIENTDENMVANPNKKKIIIIAVAAVLLVLSVGIGLVVALSGDKPSDDKLYLDFQSYMSKYLNYYSEEAKDGYTMVWYTIDDEDLPEIEKYKEELLDNYDFIAVGDDDDYCFKYIGDEDIAPIITDEKEYHIQISVSDAEDEGKSLICYCYSIDFDKTKNVEDVDKDNVADENNNDDTNDNVNDDKTVNNDKTDTEGKTDKVDKGSSSVISSKKETLAQPLNFEGEAGKKPGKSSNKIQSLFDFASDYMDVGEAKQSGSLKIYQSFDGSEDVIKIMDEYMKLLCSSGMNFSMKKSEFNDYRDYNLSAGDVSVYGEWGLEYTGTANVKETCEAGPYNDEVSCAVSIYYSMKFGKVSGAIYYSASLNPTDLGFRYGGKVESVAPAGKSACTGLIRKGGKYETTDGRFSVSLGEGVAYINGSKQNCSFNFTDYNTSSDLLKVWDKNDENLLRVFFSSSAVPKTGKFYDTQDLSQEYQWVLGGDPEGSFSYETPKVYQYVNRGWVTPSFYEDTPCDEATLRIMYYNANEKVAVFYVYSESIQTVEFLCAVDLSKAKSSGGSSSSGSSSSGDFFTQPNQNKPCTWCGGKGYKTCLVCNGDGVKIMNGKSYVCDALGCLDGKKDCPHCH